LAVILFAGDSIIGGTITVNQAAAGQIYLQLSVAFAGVLRRTLSPITSAIVTPPGVPNAPQPPTSLTTIDPQTGQSAVCNELLVAFQPGVAQQNIDSAILAVSGTLVGMLPAIGVYRVTISSCSGSSLNSAQTLLSANPFVAFAELDYVVALSQVASSPNDPYFLQGQQWSLAAVNASQASSAAGVAGVSGGVRIAIIDTGINASHEDLLGEVVPGVNWCPSYDANHACTSPNANTSDDEGHGTMVAGIAAALTNNGRGVASAVYRAHLIAEKTNIPGTNNSLPSAIANAISDAVSRSARVINISSAGPIASHTMTLAINAAVASGVVLRGTTEATR
jgi:subtilisin family serine protease